MQGSRVGFLSRESEWSVTLNSLNLSPRDHWDVLPQARSLKNWGPMEKQARSSRAGEEVATVKELGDGWPVQPVCRC